MDGEMASQPKPIEQKEKEFETRSPDTPRNTRRTSPTLKPSRLFRNQIQIIIKDKEKDRSSSSSRNRSPSFDAEHVPNFVETGVDVASSIPGSGKHSDSAISEGASMTVSQKMFDRIFDSPLIEESEGNECSSDFDQRSFVQDELDVDQIPLPSSPQVSVQHNKSYGLGSLSPEDGNNNVEKDDHRQRKEKRLCASLDRCGRRRSKSSHSNKSKEQRHRSEDGKVDSSQSRKMLPPLKIESSKEQRHRSEDGKVDSSQSRKMLLPLKNESSKEQRHRSEDGKVDSSQSRKMLLPLKNESSKEQRHRSEDGKVDSSQSRKMLLPLKNESSKEQRHRSEGAKVDSSQSRKMLLPLKNESKRKSPESERGASRNHSKTFYSTSPETSSTKSKKLKIKQEEKVQDQPSSETLTIPMKDFIAWANNSEPSPGVSDRISSFPTPTVWSIEWRIPKSNVNVKVTKDSTQMKDKLQKPHCVALSDSLVDMIPPSESSDDDTSVTPPSCTTSSQDSFKYTSTDLSSSISSSRERNSSLSSSFVSEEIESSISAQSVYPHTCQKDEEMSIMPRDYYIHTPPPPVFFQPGSYPWRPNTPHTSIPLEISNQGGSLFQDGHTTAQSRAIFEFATAVESRYKRLQPLHDPPKPNFFGYQLIGDSIFLRFAQKLLYENPILAENLRFLGLCVSGQRVGELLKRLKSDFYHIGKKVVVLIGTNDLLKNTSLEQMCAELQKVVKFLRTRAEQVVLLTLPPIPRLEAMSFHWNRLHGYNSFIKQLSTRDSGVSVSDIFPLYLRTRDEMEEEELVAEFNAKTLLCSGCLLCNSDSDLDLEDCDSDLDDTEEILDNYCDPCVKHQDISSMFVDSKLSKCRCDYYEMYFADSNRKDLIHLNHKGLLLVKDHLFKVLS